MRKLLQGMHSIDNFINDVIIFTRTFQDHLLVVSVIWDWTNNKMKQMFH